MQSTASMDHFCLVKIYRINHLQHCPVSLLSPNDTPFSLSLWHATTQIFQIIDRWSWWSGIFMPERFFLTHHEFDASFRYLPSVTTMFESRTRQQWDRTRSTSDLGYRWACLYIKVNCESGGINCCTALLQSIGKSDKKRMEKCRPKSQSEQKRWHKTYFCQSAALRSIIITRFVGNL